MITIPKSGDHPLVQGLRECVFQRQMHVKLWISLCRPVQRRRSHSIYSRWDCDSRSGGLEPSLKACEPAQEQDVSPNVVEPLTIDDSGVPQPEELTQAEVAECDLLNQQWKELLKTKPSVEVTNLSQSIPIKSRAPKDILQGLAVMVSRLRILRIPIARIHTDRAKEFLSHQFRSWIRSREWFHTTTAGDEPMSKRSLRV